MKGWKGEGVFPPLARSPAPFFPCSWATHSSRERMVRHVIGVATESRVIKASYCFPVNRPAGIITLARIPTTRHTARSLVFQRMHTCLCVLKWGPSAIHQERHTGLPCIGLPSRKLGIIGEKEKWRRASGGEGRRDKIFHDATCKEGSPSITILGGDSYNQYYECNTLKRVFRFGRSPK